MVHFWGTASAVLILHHCLRQCTDFQVQDHSGNVGGRGRTFSGYQIQWVIPLSHGKGGGMRDQFLWRILKVQWVQMKTTPKKCLCFHSDWSEVQ